MPQQVERMSHKAQPSAFSGLISHHAVAFFLLTLFHGGHSQTIGQPQPIVAMVGDDVTLPCHLTPPTDVFNEMLEWSRSDLKPRFVHIRRAGEDYLQDQNPSYMGRTSVSIEGLNKGDVSLNLSKVELSDKGTYRCLIPRLSKEWNVQLVVETDSVKITPGHYVSRPPSSAMICVIVGIIFILAVVFLGWKWRQNKLRQYKTKEHQDDEETVESRDKNSNSANDDSEQKPLIEKDTNTEKLKAEDETKEALDLKIPPKPLSEESQLTHEGQLMTGNKTDSVLVQIEGGAAEKEGQQDKNKDNINEGQNTTPIEVDTNHQPAIVGQTDQLPVAQTYVDKKEKDEKTKSGNTGNGEAKNDLDKEDKKEKTQPRNIDTEGTGLTQGLNGGQEAQQAAGETKDNLVQTVKTEGSEILSTETQKHQQDKDTVKSGDKSNSTSDDSEQVAPIATDTNTEALDEAKCSIKEERQDDKTKEKNTEDQNTTHIPGDTNCQPAIVGQTDQLPVAQTYVDKKEKDEKAKSGNTGNGEARNDLDKEDKKDIDTEGTGLTQGLNGGQEAQQAAGETKDNLDQTVKSEGSEILSTETQKHQEDKDTVKSGDKSNSTSDDSEQVAPIATDTNTEALNEATCSMHEERQDDENKDKNTEGQNTTHIPGDTNCQPAIVGQTDQLPVAQTYVDKKEKDEKAKSGNTGNGEARNDLDKEDKKDIDTEGTGLTQGLNGGQEAQQAAGETKDNLDQTVKSEGSEILSTETQKHQEDKDTVKSGDKSNSTSDDSEQVAPIATDTNTEALNEATCSMHEERQDDENKDKNTEGQNTTHIQGDTKSQPVIDGQTDQFPATQTSMKNEDEETQSGHTGAEESKDNPKLTGSEGSNVSHPAYEGQQEKNGHKHNEHNLDKEDKKQKTKPKSNDTKGQGAKGGQGAEQVEGQTKDLDLDQTEEKEKINVCEGQGGENLIPKKDNSTEINNQIPEGTQQDVAKAKPQLSTEETGTQNDADTSQGENVTSN